MQQRADPPAQDHDRLKIAILGNRGYPSTYGGFETFVRHIAPAWASQGHKVTVYCRSRPEEVSTRSWKVDDVRCIWTPGIDTKAASTLSFGLTSHMDASFRDIDVALVLNVANGYFLPFLKLRGIPVVLNTDGLEWTRGKWGPAASRVFHMGATLSTRYADVLVSDSRHLAEIWESEFDTKPRFIPYGAPISTDTGQDKIRELGIEPDSYVLVVARLAPENNIELTLDALELMPEIPAVIVGSANYGLPVASRLRDLDRSGRLRWLGHIDDQDLLTQLWSNAGVYVHGHSVGGTNPALLQALGAGAPTLALDTPFNREVLEKPDLLFPPEPAVLSKRIRSVLADPSARERMRTHGREVVAARYSWESVIDAYECGLRDALALKKMS